MARIFTDGGAMALASISQRLTDLASFSVAFWLFRITTPGTARNLIGVGTTVGWSIQLTTANLISAAVVYSGATDKVRNSVTVPTVSAWTHVVVTHNDTGVNSSDFTFYFNGKSEAGTAISNGVTAHLAGAAPLTIGAGNGLLAPGANIGPVAVWSRAISPAEALGLAGGMHPLRFKEGLVDMFDLDAAHGEEGWQAKLYLVQGATNPTSAAVSPAVEQAPGLIEVTRENVRPMIRSRTRYNVPAAGFVAEEDFIPPSMTRDDGLILMVA